MPATVALFLLAALPIGQFQAKGTVPFLPTQKSGQSPPPGQHLQVEDACLRDVSFVDARHGWAVGDGGAILHTDDGGRHWLPQTSGVICTLNSVCFVDARTGWAAGGMAWPYLHDTSGIVLATRDGGLNWRREPVLLPALHKIRFHSDRQGWAIGCSSPMYPCGVFLTRDGGRSWQPASKSGAIGLTAGDLYDGGNAILGGSSGQFATISSGDFARRAAGDCPSFRRPSKPSTWESPPGENGTVPFVPFAANLRGIHAMQVVPPSYGWLAGDGGWIALTGDRGGSWRPPLGKPPACAALFDFAALAVRGGKCWIAGTPGTRIFFTPDAGRTWSAAPTGITVPLQAIAFSDEEHGWAVGQLGTILATNDGGQTWQPQRSAGTRAALMVIAGRAEDLPLELIARTCKDQGYFGVAEVIGREYADAHSASDAPLTDRLHQAMLYLGACGGEAAWGFPVQPAELQLPPQAVLEQWNRCHAGRAVDDLVARLVRQIRTWRPDVLVVAAGREHDGVAEQIRKLAPFAFRQADNPAYAADVFRTAGCEPWTVQHLWLASESESADAHAGHLAIAADDVSPRLRQSWADAALPARGLLTRGQRPGPTAYDLQCVETTPKADVQECFYSRDIMGGTTSYTGSGSRMPTPDAALPHGGSLDGLAQRRQIENLFAHLEQDPQGTVGHLAKGDELPQDLDTAEAAALTFRVAERLRTTGQWELADKAFALLLDRYGDNPLARAVIVWRLQYLANGSGMRRAPLGTSGRLALRTQDAQQFARQIETICPDLFASPAIRYPLAAFYRRLGQEAQAERLYVLDRAGTDRDAWWNAARGERWLLDRKGPPPRPLVSCPAVAQRPHLDGHLDEALWKKCVAIELRSPRGDDGAWPAKILMAHDEKFLYVAVECRQAPGAHYEAATRQRTRGADLSEHDRVDLFLDIDRTYASYYHLTIDHRGWAADECCGDPSWNPKWFVAAATAGGAWTAEAAIPLAELNAAIVPGKTVWAVGVQRTIPGAGFQSWTAPAAPDVMPEGFGWVALE